jgi:hypothetical protein
MSDAGNQSKRRLIDGWIISLVPILFLGVSPVVTYFAAPDKIKEGSAKVQFPEKFVPLVVGLEVACGILYAIPRTAVLGAILMTGFLGGAVASHVRVSDVNFLFPLIFGTLPWLGLYLRDARIRALVPFRN